MTRTSRAKPAFAGLPLAEQIAQLPDLPIADLWALWDELFDKRPNHHNRTGLENRIAYRLQERAYGGLRPSVRKRLEAIGATGFVPGLQREEGHELLPGTVLCRTYNGIEHRVVVHGTKSFEWSGQRFKSLSAVARAITGTQWNGLLFFGLKQRKEGKA
jgi:hypothetical protein